MSFKNIFKVITAGDGAVGKTTLLHRYVKGKFLADTKMTIGVDFSVNYLDIPEGKVTLQIWDFGGEERFRGRGRGDDQRGTQKTAGYCALC